MTKKRSGPDSGSPSNDPKPFSPDDLQAIRLAHESVDGAALPGLNADELAALGAARGRLSDLAEGSATPTPSLGENSVIWMNPVKPPEIEIPVHRPSAADEASLVADAQFRKASRTLSEISIAELIPKAREVLARLLRTMGIGRDKKRQS